MQNFSTLASKQREEFEVTDRRNIFPCSSPLCALEIQTIDFSNPPSLASLSPIGG